MNRSKSQHGAHGVTRPTITILLLVAALAADGCRTDKRGQDCPPEQVPMPIGPEFYPGNPR